MFLQSRANTFFYLNVLSATALKNHQDPIVVYSQNQPILKICESLVAFEMVYSAYWHGRYISDTFKHTKTLLLLEILTKILSQVKSLYESTKYLS